MTDSLRIGVWGLTHDHVWGNLEQLRQADVATLVAAAEPDAELRAKFEQVCDAKTYASCDELLDREELDAVWLFSDNASNVELAERAAARGLHIMVEKPMADRLAGAERMLAAVRRAGVRLMVNWPFAWWPQLQHALRIVDQGVIGRVWQVKYRAAHAGPAELGCSRQFCRWLFDRRRNGGGALIDYACYGAILARVLLGVPSRVYAAAGRLCKEQVLVEDNAVVVCRYPRALALAEASWTQVGKLTSYVTTIFGTDGTLMVEPRAGGRLWLATTDCPDGQVLDVPEPERGWRSAAEHFAVSILESRPFATLCDDRAGRDAQEILDAAYRSAAAGCEVSLPLAAVD